LLCTLALAACDKQVAQKITGTLASESGPVANASLRLYRSYQSCNGDYAQAQTDASGRFLFSTESTKGGISVVTQEIALCTEQMGAWKPLWSTITEGGAPKLVITCKPKTVDEESCDIQAIYDTEDA